jgi:hypothetical protein
VTTYIKDPDARLDYAFDWKNPPEGKDAGWLEDGETIVSYQFTVAAGDVEVDTDSEADGVVTVWLTGGTVGSAQVTCHIVTSLGREDDRTMKITVKQR